ncbi:Putative sterol carrier protein [Paenibacillus larvae subsp. larvae]|uniref:Sterol carrier protein n=2 Tax=Paenibacillus larvae TaxID=1464 RepID=A0A2L1TY42_9BACL|nr:SCP2 sterol-binding domain-containing protein [Paenibacillus larvae]AVF25600.1 Putative sterol carrier protein [Paenibacillus larvae subsp. larvae]AVF30377.1 Putative sterol carrier protein [Paenibacillus larvae subsp. larvae]MCY9775408.1 SCP2 sterol-binding domain-containing protein [Paenibacillus larvae]MDR5606129.1 SCP2 sterol-binding domain-containing protein [Paenibacillus larvae]MEC0085896.1 SCP2 sterol-binding domain-containing protein [Paenibacillus larvae]
MTCIRETVARYFFFINYLLKLIEGTLNPTTAYMFGKLKIKGDLSLAMKLQGVLQRYSS